MLLYKGEKLWFQVVDEHIIFAGNESNDPRRFLIVELTPSQLNEHEFWHQLFREKVGTHTDYEENGKRAIGSLKPKELTQAFYEPYN